MYELCGQVRVNIETLALHAVAKAIPSFAESEHGLICC